MTEWLSLNFISYTFLCEVQVLHPFLLNCHLSLLSSSMSYIFYHLLSNILFVLPVCDLPFQFHDGVWQRVTLILIRHQFIHAFLIWFVLLVSYPKKCSGPNSNICVRECFSTPTSNPGTPAGCTTIKFNSDTAYWRSCRISRLRGQFHKTSSSCLPLPLLMPVASPGCHLCFWMTNYKWEGPMNPSSGWINLLEWLTDLIETLCIIVYGFIMQGYNSEVAREKQCLGQVWGKPCSAPLPIPGVSFSPHFHVCTNP